MAFDLLEGWSDRLARLGAPIVTDASPALATEQITALTEREGITLSPKP
ncbi:MAG: hypothetical protein WCF36_17655 [Candidatus Nanopelagicales bacterium]